MATKKEKIITMEPIKINTVRISITGTTDLVLNKMNDVAARKLTDERKDKAKSMEKPNEWEEIITAMHWYNGKPTDFSEEGLRKALKDNAPCITAFGLKRSFCDSVVRNEIDTYSTKFDNAVVVKAKGNLIPIKFAEHFVDEKLMSPKKGAPVLVHLNRFTGWSASIDIQYTDNVYGIDQIVDIIRRAGFGLGIGSGRKTGYGRYEVSNVEAI